MNNSHRLAYAISAILGGYAAASVAADATDTSDTGIEEILVTAQRRNESIQDVPITIQAITGTQLQQLNVTTFDDVIKYLPNVTFGTNGPGQGDIFMRGLSAGNAGNQSSATFASFPNVAVYLDDQSMQFPARNLDIYMVDMERIEVLEGPQGTLFGGGAQAGAIRYITNKPKLDKTEGNAEASYGITAGGDPNSERQRDAQPAVDRRHAGRARRRSTTIGAAATSTTCPAVSPAATMIPAITTPALRRAPMACAPMACRPRRAIAFRRTTPSATITRSRAPPPTRSITAASALAALWQDQRRLECPDHPELPEHGGRRQFGAISDRLRRPGARALADTQFVAAAIKDKFENTAWTSMASIGDMKAVYTGGYLVPPHRPDAGLFQLHAQRLRLLLHLRRRPGGGGFGTGGSPGVPAGGTPPICYSPITSWRDQVT